jgi:talin
LEHVRRWAAAKTTFTLDFGTYEKDYYTVETNRGEEISQLLSGYIDILLKRRGDGVLSHTEADADIAETEELGPLVAVPNVSTISQVGVGKYSADDFREQELLPGRMVGERGNAVDPEQKLSVDFAPAVSQARRLLGEFDNQHLVNAGAAVADPSRLRDDLLAAASKLGKAVSDMLGGLDGPADQVNVNAEAAANQLKALVDAAKLAALSTNDQALLDAGKRVAEAVARMLEASRDVSGDPNSLDAKRALQEAIASLKGASGYLQGAVNGMLTDPASEQLLLESAKQVADAIKRLAGNANRYGNEVDDPEVRKELAMLAKRAAGAGQNVQDSAKMLAPLIVDPTAKQQLLQAGKVASADCELLLKAASAKLPASEMQRLADAARAVNEALAQMLNAADTAGSRAAQNQEAMSAAAASIIRGLNEIKVSAGKPRELDHGIRTVMGAVPTLLQTAKRAAMVDSSLAPAMIQASKEVAGTSRQFQGASKSVLADPKDMERFKRLLYASQALANATKNLLGDGQKFAVFSAVRAMAKEAASATTAFANTSRRGIRDLEDESAQRRLLEAADSSSAAVAELVEALKAATLDPENINAQARLVATAKKTSKPMAAAINSGRQVVPDVQSVATKQALLFTTKEAGRAISDLVDACNKAGAVTGEQDIDEAMEMLSQTSVELDSRILDANVGALKAVSNRDASMANLQAQLQPLIAASKELAESQQVGKEAKRAATATKSVADAALAVAATVSGKDNQVHVLLTAKEIIPAIKDLIELSRQASTSNDKTLRHGGATADLREAQEVLQQKIRDMLTATQKGTGAEECEAAADATVVALNKLVMAPAYKPGDVIALSADVEQRAASLQKATQELERVVNDSKHDADVLKSAAAAVSSEVPMLVSSVNQMVAATKNTDAQDAIVRSTQVMGGHAAEALRAAATARIDSAARAKVSEEVKGTEVGKQQLETALAAATPGIAELEKATRMIDDALAMSDDLPAGEYNLQALHASTNALGDSAVHVIQAARLNPEELGKNSVGAARALAAVINGARGFSPAAQAISTAQSVERRAQTMSTDPKLAAEAARFIAVAVTRVLKSMKDAAEKEPPAVQQKMERAAATVAPALQSLLVQAQKGDVRGIRDESEKVSRELNNLTNLSSDKAKMTELLGAAKNLGVVTRSMVTEATKVARNPGDTASIEAVTRGGTALGQKMKDFKELTKALSPGHVDAVKASAAATESVANLDKNTMAATVGLLDVVTDKSHQAAKEEQRRTLEVLDKAIATLAADVNKEDYEALGLDSVAAAKCLDDMCQAAINVAASTSNQETQTDHLNQAKDVADKAAACLQINTALTTDSSSGMLKMDLKRAAGDLHDQILALLESMKGGLAGLQACDDAIATIRSAKSSLDNVGSGSQSGAGYAQLQSALIKKAGECAVSGTQLFQTAKSQPESVGEPSRALAKEVRDMVEAARDAAATSTEPAIRESLVSAARQVSDSAVNLIGSSKKVAGDAQNQLLVDELSRGFQDLTSRVTGLIRAVKEGATGERDANEAVNSIRRVVADLDQCAVYASTGDFESKGNATLDKCYEQETAAAKDVAVAAGQLVNSVAESQTNLGSASKNFASAIVRFGDSTKSLAGATGDVVTQSELFGNSKSLGSASQQLVIAAQRAQANRDDPAARQALQEKAGRVKTALQELISGVNSSLGPSVLGVKELTSAQIQIVEAIKTFTDASDAGNQAATPQDIALQLRRMKKANESLMTVTGTSDKATSVNARELGEATAQMLRNTKGNFRLVSSQKAQVRADVAANAIESAKKVLAYLELSKTQRRDKEDVVNSIQDASIGITELSQKTIESARGIPGGEDLELEENKLEDKASQQLLAAAEQIKAAAAMLMNAPRRVKDPSAELDEEDIAADLLDRAREITSSTYDLLIASIDAQREIQSMGKASSTANAYRSDPQWAQGLISAAKAVGMKKNRLMIFF